MINPWLAQRLFQLPVRPVIVETDASALDRLLAGPLRQLQVRNRIPLFSMVSLLAVPSRLIPALAALPGVRAVHADLEVNALETQLPANNRAVWWPTSESRNVLEADLAFRQGFTGESVRLAVVDTGIDPLHPQLQGSQWESVIMAPVREVVDENGHGSHVASTAGGRLQFADPGVFVEGVSRAPVLSIKALGRGVGTGFTSEIVNAMALALERGARVVNLSLGSQECQGSCETCPECRAVRRLTQQGVLVFVAAGNSGPEPDTINCPGCTPEAITVAAVDRDGRVAGFSSRGGPRYPLKPDLAAPGVDIYSGTSRGSLIDFGDPEAGFGFAAISGTSMATPHAAGLGAILKHRNPGLTTDQFKQRLRERGEGFNHNTGWGVPRWSWF
jgi:subtilisin family serine protease